MWFFVDNYYVWLACAFVGFVLSLVFKSIADSDYAYVGYDYVLIGTVVGLVVGMFLPVFPFVGIVILIIMAGFESHRFRSLKKV